MTRPHAWERELEDVVRQRGDALVGYAYLLAGDLAAAEDLVQEGLVRTFARRRSGGDVDGLEASVRLSVLHAFVDGRRRSRRSRDVAHLVVVPERGGERTTHAGDRDLVLGALAHLTPRQRACVVLRSYEDLPLRDIAERLDLSEGAVKRSLRDADRALAPQLGPQPVLTAEDVPTTTKGGRR